MRKTSVFLLLLLTLIIAIGIAFQDFRFDKSSTAEQTAAASRDRDLAAVSTRLAELRTAQVAYLAAGQNPEFWTQHVASIAAGIDEDLTKLRAGARSSEGARQVDAAIAAFADIMAADKRARGNLESDQLLVASDVILADSLENVQRFQVAIAAARDAETSASQVTMQRLSRLRLGTTGGGMAGMVCVALVAVLLSLPTRQAASPAASMAQMLRELPPPVKNAPPGSVAAPATLAAQPMPAAASASAAATLSLPDAAELCVDLARVMDGRDIPGLLQRAARLLDASGLIVWVVDSPGTTLQPMITHGYPDRVLRRLGTLETSADNVTSLSFRSGKPQCMNAAETTGTGALAVPLVTASGCAGVLAAEIRQARPAPESLALARIVAAQLGTIIGPVDIAASKVANA